MIKLSNPFNLEKVTLPERPSLVQVEGFSELVMVWPSVEKCTVRDELDNIRINLGEDTPALYAYCEDRKRTVIAIHSEVPDELREVVALHEFAEAYLNNELGVPTEWAHRIVLHLERDYAVKFMDDATFEKYLDFRQELAKANET